MMKPPFTPIPERLQPLYVRLRVLLLIIFFLCGLALTYSFLFPTITTTFDFRNPNSSRNQIFDPRGEDGSLKTNGRMAPNEKLIANTSPLGDFSVLSASINLEKKSATPAALDVSVRKGYRAFFFPLGEPMQDLETKSLYRVEDTYYELRGNELHPFVSEAAFLSRFPKTAATLQSEAWREQYSVAKEFIGFRVGSLVSFADGIYVITSERDMRPIGSAEIFLALGYNFEDVIPGNEEDLGIYKRGRIFLMGVPHPDGTLFQDQNTLEYFLIEAGKRRPLLRGAYLDFLLTQTHPIIATTPDASTEAHCRAEVGLLPRTLDCTIDLTPLERSIGPDYEVTLAQSESDIDVASLALAFDTRLNAENGATLLSKVKNRLLARFGQE